MKTCWQILEIESTTQIDIIRQAYLARLPLCHPETDPQGFKALRQAYEIMKIKMPPLNMKYYVHSGHYWIQKVIVFSPPPGRNLFSN